MNNEREVERYSARDLEDPSPANQQVVRALYQRAHDAPESKGKVIHRLLPQSVGSPASFSRWRSGEQPLSPQGHKDLVHHLAKHGLLDPRSRIHASLKELTEHPLFHALTVDLNIRLQTLSDIARRAIGTYRLWRPSLHWHERFVLGMLRIEEGSEHSIRVSEVHKFRGTDSSIPAESVCEGYLVRKSTHYLIVARDSGSKFVTCMMLNNPIYHADGKQIVALGGAAFSMFGNRVHAHRVYAERWNHSDEALLQELDLVSEQDVPDSVLQKLRDIDPNPFGVRF